MHQWSFVAYNSFSRSWRVEEQRLAAAELTYWLEPFNFSNLEPFGRLSIIKYWIMGVEEERETEKKKKVYIIFERKQALLNWKEKYLQFVILFWKRKNAKVMAANIVAMALAALFSLNNIEFSWKWFCKLSFSEAQNLPQQASIHQENCI